MNIAFEGVSAQTFFKRFSGLSQAHVSSHGLTTKTAARARQAEAFTQQKLGADLQVAGYSLREIEEIFANAPSGAYAGFAYGLGLLGVAKFPLSGQRAESLDLAIGQALTALASRDIAAYRAAAISVGSGCLALLEGELADNVKALVRVLEQARTWLNLISPTSRLLDHAWWAFAAGLDLEWHLSYLSPLEPEPTLPWLWPRFHPDFDERNSHKLKKGVVIHPAQSLLQVMWLLVKRKYDRQGVWPRGYAGATELAEDIGLVALGDGQLRKLFIGEKKATGKVVVSIWRSLCQTLSPREEFDAPWLWIVMAIWFERHMVTPDSGSRRAKSILIPSEDLYRALWQGHRRRWAAQLPMSGNLRWPDWLLDQRSSPSWMRSSQSTGRSSSARDCQ